ncbi:U4/U6-U5 snRNP complex subunit PRP3 KNAG_0C06140 [Huiozyma naganishii CBS 8797]|uniref:Uncharacterized protein n=1 Tax=Huiozyma naganishii (strain ATCC MYA-139 / BCRC 22969 / CBS 8797 / KCTC 17520 / NBRC 10181 / NCYC 3082 / Yp74L-3) TaxID=1071383 RepID=J7R4D3_HUIN7|nr:hypothetical protein KNAG_0C06140 [Kazachstania naganishii CBS 8797]CCK69710.1 hypothetical protein KNAG_0C06140 [Kazachstania naganishii CBS 8797]
MGRIRTWRRYAVVAVAVAAGAARREVVSGRGWGHFIRPGEVARDAQLWREQRKAELEEQRKEESRRKEEELQRRQWEAQEIASGRIPDPELGEAAYLKRFEDIPEMEWWDVPYVDDNHEVMLKYLDADYVSDDDEDDDGVAAEDNAVSIHYVVHPIPMKQLPDSVGTQHRLYLTKEERKKLRRNRRDMLRKEEEQKLKLGLIAKPQPKVKLQNMMNVLENNFNISNPSLYEAEVKEQVARRRQEHERINQERHDTARKIRQEAATAENSSKTNTGAGSASCKIYRFKQLVNPSIRYKLKMNSEQLQVKGFCLRFGDDGPGTIVVAGPEKSCNKMDRLILHRLPWSQDFTDRNTGDTVHMSDNSIEKTWEGVLISTDHFPKRWFMKVCQTQDEYDHTLKHFNCDHS